MARNYRKIAGNKARKYGLNPRIFKRQIKAESNFNPKAVSHAGARGIAQIMPETAKGWGVNPDKPIKALDAAAKNMAGYLNDYNGDYSKALAAYNAGPNAVAEYGGVPPFAETRAYVDKILNGINLSGKGKKSKGKKVKFGPAKIDIPLSPGKQEVDYSAAILDNILSGAKQSLFETINLASEDPKYLKNIPGTSTTVTVPGAKRRVVGKNGKSPKGLEVKRDGNKGAKHLAEQATKGVYLSGERPTKHTASGNISDHYDQMDDRSAVDAKYGSGRKIAKRLGIKKWKPGTYDRHVITVDGRQYSVQILEDVEGHYDHTHVGIQRL